MTDQNCVMKKPDFMCGKLLRNKTCAGAWGGCGRWGPEPLSQPDVPPSHLPPRGQHFSPIPSPPSPGRGRGNGVAGDSRDGRAAPQPGWTPSTLPKDSWGLSQKHADSASYLRQVW